MWQLCSGVDERAVEPCRPRHSVGAEVNYGLRFKGDVQQARQQAEAFLLQLAGEVADRMTAAGVWGGWAGGGGGNGCGGVWGVCVERMKASGVCGGGQVHQRACDS